MLGNKVTSSYIIITWQRGSSPHSQQQLQSAWGSGTPLWRDTATGHLSGYVQCLHQSGLEWEKSNVSVSSIESGQWELVMRLCRTPHCPHCTYKRHHIWQGYYGSHFYTTTLTPFVCMDSLGPGTEATHQATTHSLTWVRTGWWSCSFCIMLICEVRIWVLDSHWWGHRWHNVYVGMELGV